MIVKLEKVCDGEFYYNSRWDDEPPKFIYFPHEVAICAEAAGKDQYFSVHRRNETVPEEDTRTYPHHWHIEYHYKDGEYTYVYHRSDRHPVTALLLGAFGTEKWVYVVGAVEDVTRLIWEARSEEKGNPQSRG